jgi:uncharacterized membrane protein YfcA
MLIAVGVPAVAANVTNTVALCPGYFGATLAQANDLNGQRRRLWLLLPAAAIGGVIGAFLLLNTGERLFRTLVPYLILLASVLLALQGPMRAWLQRRASHRSGGILREEWATLPVGIAAIYGGYFGAGLSVKQAIALTINVAAAIFFLFSGQIEWLAVLVMAAGALAGGAIGGRVAGRIRPATLRWTVVTIGITISLIYFVRG